MGPEAAVLRDAEQHGLPPADRARPQVGVGPADGQRSWRVMKLYMTGSAFVLVTPLSVGLLLLGRIEL